MKKIFSIFPLFFGLVAAAPVLAQQQKNDYSPLIKQSYSNYKDVYNPDTNVVYESGDALLTTSHADLSLERVKFFVPPGTKRFTVSFLTYLSPQESKATGRFGAVPTKTAADVTAATMLRSTANTLERLVAGEELPFYSPGGSGNLGISQPYQFDTFQVNSGGYIYLHILSVPGGKVKTLQTRMVVEEACYRSWYTNAQWDAQGNPDENATHTCAGSSGGTPTPLTGITLSRAVWNAATDANNTTITVTPQPAGAVLPTCTSSLPNLLTAGPVSATGAQFIINPTALTATTPVTITCGEKTATLELQLAGTVAVVQTKELTAVDGLAQLVVTLKHTDAELLLANTEVDYWVLGTPTAFVYAGTNELFFLSALDAGGFEWKYFSPSLNFAPFLFKKALRPYSLTTTKLQNLTIPLGFSANDFKDLGVKVDLWYNQKNGGYHRVGTIWDFATDGIATTPVTTENTDTGS